MLSKNLTNLQKTPRYLKPRTLALLRYKVYSQLSNEGFKIDVAIFKQLKADLVTYSQNIEDRRKAECISPDFADALQKQIMNILNGE